MEIGFLGPRGTFTELAANKYMKDSKKIAFHTIADVIRAVEDNVVAEGIVPIENSTEGAVNQTLDSLIFDTNIFIKVQLTIPIIHNLIISLDNKEHTVEKILSHNQALAQCRKYINKNYPNAIIQEVSSTAQGCRMVSESGENIAAIGTALCAEIYGLNILEKHINDEKINETTFVVLAKQNTMSPELGSKISIAFATENKPGELYKILDIFALWNLNMTKILSRPMKGRVGEYVFYIDIEDYNDPKDVTDALTMIKRKTSFFKILGSYNRLNF